MNIRDLSALEWTAAWLTELIRACQRGSTLYGWHPRLAADVTRKAKALRTSFDHFRKELFPDVLIAA